jgi:hypothetical protein
MCFVITNYSSRFWQGDNMRIHIFEENPSILNLLVLFLKNKGHQVHGFSDGYKCPLFLLDECICPADKPCAEALIVNIQNPNQENVQILLDQEEKRCKLHKRNKAIMSSDFTPEQEQSIQDQGFTTIKKPFRFAAISNWLDECTTRS